MSVCLVFLVLHHARPARTQNSSRLSSRDGTPPCGIAIGCWRRSPCRSRAEDARGAIEILAACQAIDFHRPLRTTPPLEAVHAEVRKVAARWVVDRVMAPDIDAVSELVRSGALLRASEPLMEEV